MSFDHTATYSPEDNKLRLYPGYRLPKEEYERVRESGFSWAPKQELFVAPMWTPEREDFLIELAGEIGDEDTSLVDRAEQRAERFEDYSDSRQRDADQARAGVARIADGIPLGQPILIGHHSERHARRDAEKIENGMRRAVRMWETAGYWKERAKGAIHAAKYKERPDVRARRIKGLEADLRRCLKADEVSSRFLGLWNAEGVELTRERALAISNSGECHVSRCFLLKDYPRNPPASQYEGQMGLWSALDGGVITPEQAREIATSAHSAGMARRRRWIDHYTNRLEYERAMLAEGGGLAADQFDIQPGGRVLHRSEWFVVVKVNRQFGRINSVTVLGHWQRTMPIEEVQDYQPPAEGLAEKVKAAVKPLPLCNFRTDGCIEMTTAEWKQKSKWTDALAVRGFDANGAYHWRSEQGNPSVYRHRSRYYLGDHVNGSKVVHVFLTDAKETKPPAGVIVAKKAVQESAKDLAPMRDDQETLKEADRLIEWRKRHEAEKAESVDFQAMRDGLKAGTAVQVVSANQLFPTPRELAERMVRLADVQAGETVLEPSAGTGNIVRAVLDAVDTEVLAYEINPNLCGHLSRTFPSYKAKAVCEDFLNVTDYQGCYPVVLMNPPFENGADIKHIQHAIKFLKPGGRLVAICANGPRQQAQLRPIVESHGGEWEELPTDTFKEQGTGVRAVLLHLTAR